MATRQIGQAHRPQLVFSRAERIACSCSLRAPTGSSEELVGGSAGISWRGALPQMLPASDARSPERPPRPALHFAATRPARPTSRAQDALPVRACTYGLPCPASFGDAVVVTAPSVGGRTAPQVFTRSVGRS